MNHAWPGLGRNEREHKMRLSKHYVVRTDSPARSIPCKSLEEAKRRAETQWEIAHYSDKPSLSICERDGTEVAWMRDGKWR